MNKLTLVFKSRTVWTLIVMVGFNLIPNLPFNQGARDLINAILGLTATYFKINPSQNYSDAN